METVSEQQESSASGRGKHTRLGSSEKYEIFTNVLSGQGTQGEVAERFHVGRLVVVQACRVAVQGALEALAASVPVRKATTEKSAEQRQLEEAQAEIERLRATVTEQAVELYTRERQKMR